MSTDRTKTLTGPYTLDLQDALLASKFKIENRHKDKVTFEITRKMMEDELDDDSSEYFKGGLNLKIEANFREIDEEQLNDTGMEDTSIVSVILSFPNKNKKVTITVDVLDGGDLIYGEVVGGGGRITILKSLPIGTYMDDMITIAAIAE